MQNTSSLTLLHMLTHNNNNNNGNGISSTYSDPRRFRRKRNVQIWRSTAKLYTKAFSATSRKKLHRKKETDEALPSLIKNHRKQQQKQLQHQRKDGYIRNMKSGYLELPEIKIQEESTKKKSSKIRTKLLNASSKLKQTRIMKNLLECTQKRIDEEQTTPDGFVNTSPILMPDSPYKRPGSNLVTSSTIRTFRKRLQVTPLRKISDNLFVMNGSSYSDRVPVVLVSVGTFNLPHLNHKRIFHLGKKHLEKDGKHAVVGGFVCPSHDKFVLTKCRGKAHEAIPARHRVRMLELLFKNSSWIDVDRWEVTRKCGFMDYPTVLEHISKTIRHSFGDRIEIVCLCGSTHLLRLTSEILNTHRAVCITRRGYVSDLVHRMAEKWKGRISIHIDDEIIPISLANATSTRIRKRLCSGDVNVEDMTGREISEYIAENRIAEKLANRRSWSSSDRSTKALVRPQTFLAELDRVSRDML
jgi:nicotinic acid mononucleotide adenylyltransferase